MRNKQAEALAKLMIKRHGFVKAKRLQESYRDRNSPGTFSFMYENQICKAFSVFATAGRLKE